MGAAWSHTGGWAAPLQRSCRAFRKVRATRSTWRGGFVPVDVDEPCLQLDDDQRPARRVQRDDVDDTARAVPGE
jgi:hypothetical protein